MEPRGSLPLSGEWRLQHAAFAGGSGATVSRPGFAAADWHRTEVPSTVLRALVRDGTYRDPRFGLDVYTIPDAADEFNAEHDLAKFSHLTDRRNPWREPWWYRTEVALREVRPEERVWLTLNCLNYRADVWVNGRQAASREQLVGMFRRFRLDITAAVTAGQNAIAILVCPVAIIGVPDTQLGCLGRCAGSTRTSATTITG